MSDDRKQLTLWSALDADAAACWAKVDQSVAAQPSQPSAKRSAPKRSPRRPLIKTPASPTVIVFPLARRRDFVLRQAARMADLSAERVYAHLNKQLLLQANALRRKGIAESVIDIEISNLFTSVRAELWHILFGVPAQGGSSR